MRKSLRTALSICAFGLGGVTTLSLDACSSLLKNMPQYAVDSADIASGLTTAVHDMEQAKLLSAPTAEALDAALVDVNSAATAVAHDTALASASSDVSKLVSAANVVVADLAGAPKLPASVRDILDAAQTLMPVIEASVGIVVPASASISMTPEAARNILEHAGH